MHSFNAEEKLNSEEKLGYLNLMNKTFSLMTYHITQMTLERYSPDVLINVSRHCCGAFDFHKAEEMVETGRHAAIKSLGAYGLEENKQAG